MMIARASHLRTWLGVLWSMFREESDETRAGIVGDMAGRPGSRLRRETRPNASQHAE